jgi:hypothetical protein
LVRSSVTSSLLRDEMMMILTRHVLPTRESSHLGEAGEQVAHGDDGEDRREAVEVGLSRRRERGETRRRRRERGEWRERRERGRRRERGERAERGEGDGREARGREDDEDGVWRPAGQRGTGLHNGTTECLLGVGAWMASNAVFLVLVLASPPIGRGRSSPLAVREQRMACVGVSTRSVRA